MTFTVSSNSFKDGDYLAKDFILSADFGFGCAGGNKSPHLKWSGAPAASSLTFDGMFTTSQCQKPEPVGASGSKQVTAKLLVPAGAPLHLRCGDLLPPAQPKPKSADRMKSLAK